VAGMRPRFGRWASRLWLPMGCPPVRVVYEDHPGGWQSEQPAPCPRCGREPNAVCVVYDPDFYGNAERLVSLQG